MSDTLFYVCRYSILSICSLTDPVSLWSVKNRRKYRYCLLSCRYNVVSILSGSAYWSVFLSLCLVTEFLLFPWRMPTWEQPLGSSCNHGFEGCSQSVAVKTDGVEPINEWEVKGLFTSFAGTMQEACEAGSQVWAPTAGK